MRQPLNYEKIYKYRFTGIPQTKKQAVWREIAEFLYQKLGRPNSVMDPACGDMEFLMEFPAARRVGVDLRSPNEGLKEASKSKNITVHVGDVFEFEVKDKVALVYISNFLEHLPDIETAHALLLKVKNCLEPSGRIVVMGPNFKYTQDCYFDFCDHKLILTHFSLCELLVSAGFEIEECIPRFLPYTFKSRLPASGFLTRLYLKLPWVWPFFGKQFFVIAKKHSSLK